MEERLTIASVQLNLYATEQLLDIQSVKLHELLWFNDHHDSMHDGCRMDNASLLNTHCFTSARLKELCQANTRQVASKWYPSGADSSSPCDRTLVGMRQGFKAIEASQVGIHRDGEERLHAGIRILYGQSTDDLESGHAAARRFQLLLVGKNARTAGRHEIGPRQSGIVENRAIAAAWSISGM